MTKSEIPKDEEEMTKTEIPNDESKIRNSSFLSHWVFRHSSFP